MSPDPNKPSDSEPRAKPASAAPEETDEDLFNFDELLSASKPKESLPKDLEDVLAEVESAKVEVARDVAAAEAASAAQPRPAPQSEVKPVAAQPAAAPRVVPPPIKHIEARPAVVAAPAPAPATVVHQKLSMSPLAGLLLGAVVLANVTLMVVAWTSVQSVKQLVLDVTHDVADTTSELRSESTRRSELTALESEPVFGALPEGYRTMEIAKERMKRGEHARARRMLFGLLAVVDRIEQPARSEVEAQAGFLIADSFRLEAQALRKGELP